MAASIDSYYLRITFPKDWKDSAYIKVTKSISIQENKISYFFERCEKKQPSSSSSSSSPEKFYCYSVGHENGYPAHEIDGKLFPIEDEWMNLENSYQALSQELATAKTELEKYKSQFQTLQVTYKNNLEAFTLEKLESRENWDFIKEIISGGLGAGTLAIPFYLAFSSPGQSSWISLLLSAIASSPGAVIGLSSYYLYDHFIAGSTDQPGVLTEEEMLEFNNLNADLITSYKKAENNYQHFGQEYNRLKAEFDSLKQAFESTSKTLLIFNMTGDKYLELINDL